MKNILDLTMFFSVLINLIYFNYYLSLSITKKGLKSIINENKDWNEHYKETSNEQFN